MTQIISYTQRLEALRDIVLEAINDGWITDDGAVKNILEPRLRDALSQPAHPTPQQIALTTQLTATFDVPSGSDPDAMLATLQANIERLAGLGRAEGMFTAGTDAELNDLTLHAIPQPVVCPSRRNG